MLDWNDPRLELSAPHGLEILDQRDDSIPVKEMRCPDLRHIANAWEDMPRVDGEALPRWSCFNPRDFIRMLPKICVLHVGDWQADEIEFTVYGEHATKFIGLGHPLRLRELRNDELRSANYFDIRNRAGRAVDTAKPQYVLKTLSWNGCDNVEYEAIMLPFQRQGAMQRVLQPVSATVIPDLTSKATRSSHETHQEPCVS